jgi:hypothetical protein
MKYMSFFKALRFSLVLSIAVGLCLIVAYSLPFETAARWINQLAPDGNFASLTRERYQVLSRLLGILGFILTLSAAILLSTWPEAQQRIEKTLFRGRDFKKAFRAEALTFLETVSPRHWNRGEFIIITGLVLVALITRLASIMIPLTHDEAYTYNTFASGSLWYTVSNYPLPNNHVLLSIMINIVTDLFGNQLWFVRTPTLIVGLLMVPASYWLGRRLYSRETALLSAAWVAVFPVLVEYSVLARGYIVLGLITLLILALGDYVREHRNRFAWLCLIVCSALGFYTVPVMLFPFGALYLWLFLSCILGDTKAYRSKADFIKHWLVSGLATALLTALLYAPILLNDLTALLGNRVIAPLGWDIFPITIWVRLKNTWADWTRSIPGFIVVLGVLGLAAGLMFHRKISRHRFPLQIAFLIWIALMLVTRRPNMVPRMWLFLAAPVLIWSAGGLIESVKLFSAAWKNPLPLSKIVLGIGLVSVVALGLATIPTIRKRWEQKSSVESAAVYLKSHLQEDDLVIASTKYLPQLKYYFEIYAIPQENLRRSGSFPRAFILIGQQERATLESVAPKDGFNQPVVDLNTIKAVLQFDDLIVYEGYPVP